MPAAKSRRSKWLRYVISGVALAVLLGVTGWYFFRFTAEKHTAEHFMEAVAAGNFQQAYQIWKPHSSYSYEDFLADWGLQGYYGPVQSYRIEAAHEPQNGGSGIIVGIEVSPVRPFPADSDPQSGKNRRVSLWVERSDQSLSFPP